MYRPQDYLKPDKPHIVEVTDATKWWGREPGSEYYKKHEGNLVVKVKCRVMDTPHLIELKEDDWIRWRELGQYAQDVFMTKLLHQFLLTKMGYVIIVK